MRKITRLLALLVCAALPATAWPQTVMAPAGMRGAGLVTPAGRAFLFSLNFHLDQAALRFGTLSAGSLPQTGTIAAYAREAEVARYLGKAALATTPQAVGPSIPAQAARFAAQALADPAARPRTLAFLRAQGALGAEAAEKIEALSPKPEALESIRRLADDLLAASGGGSGNHLERFFSGGEESLGNERNASGPVLTDPEAFASYAERRFHPGLLRSGAAVAYKKASHPAVEAVPGDKELSDEVALSPLTNPERERLVVELFRQAGAQASEIRLQDSGRGRNNIIVVKKGRSDRVVVVGGHHDKVSVGAGTIDNWTGATMVINLYQAMRDLDTEATYVFIAFAREEEGLLGSSRYVDGLSKDQRSKIDAMINLDTLGVDGTFSWKNNSTRSLLDLIAKTAGEERLDLVETVLYGGDADSSSFRRVGIAAMTVFGASDAVIWDIIHSANDNFAAFSLPNYKNAYLLTLALLKRMDHGPVRAGLAALASAASRLAARLIGRG